MNPKDVIEDALHNFSPQYQQYTRQGPLFYPFIIEFM